MITELLRQGALNDDVIHYPEEGKIFKGGYIAIIEEWTFLNEWNNRKEVRRFRSQKSLNEYLSKNYPNY